MMKKAASPPIYAGMLELVDRMDLGSIAERRWGSSPHTRTNEKTP